VVEKGKIYKKILITFIAFIFGILTLFPFIWMISTSFKTQKEVYRSSMSIIPESFSFDNYIIAFESAPMPRYMFNSILVSGVSTLGVVITSILAGYALSRIQFPFRNTLFIIILGTMMIPHQSIMIPSFILMKNFGWLDSYMVLIIPFLVYPFAVFILRNFFMAIPKELEEAAFLDGCSRLQLLYKIFVPISLPAVASVVIFNFTYIWNDFFWPLVMTKSVDIRTVQVGLAMLKSEFLLQWPMLMAATVLSSIPIFIVYLMFQKYFVKGSVSSGVKG
jgi:multiple sugar transport system permease protein